MPAISSTAASVEIYEAPYSKWKQGYIYGLGSQDVIKSYMSTSKIYGLGKRAVKDENDFSAAVTANPVSEWHWKMYVWNGTGSTSTSYITMSVKITYYVKFFGRKTLSQS